VDIWGDVLVKIGHEQNIGCAVTNGGPRHQIKWTLGDKILTDTFEKESEEGVLEEYVKFTPSLEDDGKQLSCSFGGTKDAIRLEVFQQTIEEGPSETEMMTFGEKNSVEMLVRLFPPPSNDDVTWKAGKDIAVHPGQKEGIYTAQTIQKIQDEENLYKLVLEVLVDNKTVASRQHSVSIVTRGNTKTIQFNIEIKPEVATAGVPFWIWILVIIVAIIGLIVIFIVVRNSRKKKTSTDDKEKNDADKEQGSLLSKQENVS